jgi:hypothetical protein
MRKFIDRDVFGVLYGVVIAVARGGIRASTFPLDVNIAPHQLGGSFA